MAKRSASGSTTETPVEPDKKVESPGPGIDDQVIVQSSGLGLPNETSNEPNPDHSANAGTIPGEGTTDHVDTEIATGAAPTGDPMPEAVPPELLPPGHKRPTLDEFVAAGYQPEVYEGAMRQWEHRLVAAADGGQPPEAPEPTEPALSVTGEQVQPPAMPVDENGAPIPTVRATKGVIYGALFFAKGDRFHMHEEEIEKRVDLGEVERL